MVASARARSGRYRRISPGWDSGRRNRILQPPHHQRSDPKRRKQPTKIFLPLRQVHMPFSSRFYGFPAAKIARNPGNCRNQHPRTARPVCCYRVITSQPRLEPRHDLALHGAPGISLVFPLSPWGFGASLGYNAQARAKGVTAACLTLGDIERAV